MGSSSGSGEHRLMSPSGEEKLVMKPWLWRLPSDRVALRNAQHASAVLAQRRRERDEIEAYLAEHDRRTLLGRRQVA